METVRGQVGGAQPALGACIASKGALLLNRPRIDGLARGDDGRRELKLAGSLNVSWVVLRPASGPGATRPRVPRHPVRRSELSIVHLTSGCVSPRNFSTRSSATFHRTISRTDKPCGIVRWSRSRGSAPAEDAFSNPFLSTRRTASRGWTTSHPQTPSYSGTSAFFAVPALAPGTENLPPGTPILITSTSTSSRFANFKPSPYFTHASPRTSLNGWRCFHPVGPLSRL